MRKTILLLSLQLLLLNTSQAQKKTLDQKVDALLKQMTLDEKIGQMNQYSGDWAATGPITKDGDKQTQIKNGRVGSMLNVTGVEHTRTLQQIALQSRLKIPLLFGQDVIHGYRTTFPIPLAESASWDLQAMENSARIAAIEASAAGLHWIFAPMVDIARDPRWGRVMEGAGEDPYLGSLIAAARVKGLQGKGLGNADAVMACVKHFAAYGAVVGGREYNSVDMSLRQLWETYLPPFKAAAEAGAATFMNAFNDLNGIPATGNSYLQREILKGKWKFKGFVVSDWGSVGEMIDMGFVKDTVEAAMAAANAGCDVDMESRSYIKNLATLVKEGKVKMTVIDDAVKRILRKKFEMGLFDDPYKFCNEQREKQEWNNEANLKAARVMAAKSIVLLKNDPVKNNAAGDGILPLSKQTKKVALIGPFVKAVRDNLGFWSFSWPDDSTRIVTIWDGIKTKLGSDGGMLYAKGCNINDADTSGFAEAVALAMAADVAIITVGEAADMSGEAKSRSNLQLPGVQEQLVKAIYKTGKPMVVLIGAGRPLIFNWIADNAPAIVYTWWLGTQAGNAIADVLFGDYNPSGKLPMSFPRAEGQIPIYYNHYNTGRPALNDSDLSYVSAYTDLVNSPRYAFGYGLSYSHFSYGNLELDKKTIRGNEKLTVKVSVTNSGNFDGEETVQLYIRDVAASMIRPVKELKGFQKIFLKKGETKTVTFYLTTNDLKFYNNNLQWVYEPGDFTVFVGGNSSDTKAASFAVEK